METIREQIIKAITIAAQALSVHPVERARRSYFEHQIALQPFISIWDGDNETLDRLFGAKKMQFALAVECVWNADSTNSSVSANALAGDVIKTIIEATNNNDLIDDIDDDGYSITYPNDGINYTALSVNFIIKYSTVQGDPYTKPTF